MGTKRRREPPGHLVRLGRRLAELRRRRGLSQADLAEAVGTATESVSRIERAVAIPSLGMLARIASVLGVEVEHLFSARVPEARRRLDPDVGKLVALVQSKPAAVRRRIVRLVRLFLAR